MSNDRDSRGDRDGGGARDRSRERGGGGGGGGDSEEAKLFVGNLSFEASYY
jgi:hypothetical protein